MARAPNLSQARVLYVLSDMRTRALTHVAMSLPLGTLTAEYRARLVTFYSSAFGWQEMQDLSRPDRLTIAIGRGAYINIREHDRPMLEGAYEHFGVLVRSADEVHKLNAEVKALGGSPGPVEEPVDGHPMFRFQHLLPMAIEVQFVPRR